MKTIKSGIIVLLLTLMTVPFSVEAKKPTPAKEVSISLTGVVVDKLTQEELAGVYIFFEELQKGVYSEPDGTFNFEGIQPGKYSVTVKYISYHESHEVIKVKNSKRNYKSIQLKPIEP